MKRYKIPVFEKTQQKTTQHLEGETIETKVERILQNKGNIDEGIDVVYSERRQGVLAEANIRWDKWDGAIDGFALITGTILKNEREEDFPTEDKTDEAESTQTSTENPD